MKKIFLTAAIAATLFTGAFAAETINVTNTDKVSYQLQNQLNADFPGAENISWSATKVGQKADFEIDGKKMSAFYDNQGQSIGYTEDVAFKALPNSAKKEIANKYYGYMVSEVIKFEPTQPANGYERLLNGGVQSMAYFVDLKSDKEEVLLKITPQADISLYKQIR